LKTSGSGWTFRGRNRRPPNNPVNACFLSIHLLLNNVVSAVLANQLDPSSGFFTVNTGQASVALDMMEGIPPSIL
jgi:CRISPR/Cas system-associated endonuclease Cas1